MPCNASDIRHGILQFSLLYTIAIQWVAAATFSIVLTLSAFLAQYLDFLTYVLLILKVIQYLILCNRYK